MGLPVSRAILTKAGLYGVASATRTMAIHKATDNIICNHIVYVKQKKNLKKSLNLPKSSYCAGGCANLYNSIIMLGEIPIYR